ncbi:MAG: HDOD domain-containing protein, partial [Proteobacteria bacterium]|nr:HDOD domain-containing protein [Pseudomonadota bacterium]
MTQQTRDGEREKLALEIAGAVVADNDKLPTLPSVVWEINRLIRDEKSSAADLERLIMTDPVLTSKVLAFANSVFFASRSTTSNIRQAIVRVGLNTVQNLILGVGVTGAFGTKGEAEGFSLTELWRHSLGVAATCATMVRRVPLSVPPEDAYTAGLLHDLG